jgi:hypothetical protein
MSTHNILHDVYIERRRQVEKEGWTAEHDDAHSDWNLSYAAASYAVFEPEGEHISKSLWPWQEEWFKPTTPRRNLIKAMALLCAELERLDRKKQRELQEAHV